MAKNKSRLFEKRSRYGYIFILPLILGVLFIFIPNIVKTIMYSLSEIDTANGFKLDYQGFDFYNEALRKDPKFIPFLLSGLQSLALNVPIIVIYSLFMATLLNQEFKGRAIARVIFFIPVILSTGILARTDGVALQYGSAVVDTGVSSVSGLADVSVWLSSMNFPNFLIDIVSNSVNNIYNITRSSGLQIYIYFLRDCKKYPLPYTKLPLLRDAVNGNFFGK